MRGRVDPVLKQLGLGLAAQRRDARPGRVGRDERRRSGQNRRRRRCAGSPIRPASWRPDRRSRSCASLASERLRLRTSSSARFTLATSAAAVVSVEVKAAGAAAPFGLAAAGGAAFSSAGPAALAASEGRAAGMGVGDRSAAWRGCVVAACLGGLGRFGFGVLGFRRRPSCRSCPWQASQPFCRASCRAWQPRRASLPQA